MLLRRLVCPCTAARLISCITSSANLFYMKSTVIYSPICKNCCMLPTAALKFRRISSLYRSSIARHDDHELGTASIEKLCKIGNLSAAVHLLRELTDRQAHICVGVYNTLLNSAIEANDFNQFSKVFRFLLLSVSAPNADSYKSVAKVFAVVVDSEKVLIFIREMCEIAKDREPTVMNRIIFALAESAQTEKAMLVFGELKKMNSNFDLVTFNTVLGILGKAGLVDQMLSEFEAMKGLGFYPDAITYNTIINSLRRLGKFRMCMDMAREMSEKGIELDLRTYTALIDSLGRAGLIKDAIILFEQMKQYQRPSIYVYRALISNLRKAGNFELAMKFSDEMDSSFSQLLGPRDFKRNFAGRRGKCKK